MFSKILLQVVDDARAARLDDLGQAAAGERRAVPDAQPRWGSEGAGPDRSHGSPFVFEHRAPDTVIGDDRLERIENQIQDVSQDQARVDLLAEADEGLGFGELPLHCPAQVLERLSKAVELIGPRSVGRRRKPWMELAPCH